MVNIELQKVSFKTKKPHLKSQNFTEMNLTPLMYASIEGRVHQTGPQSEQNGDNQKVAHYMINVNELQETGDLCSTYARDLEKQQTTAALENQKEMNGRLKDAVANAEELKTQIKNNKTIDDLQKDLQTCKNKIETLNPPVSN